MRRRHFVLTVLVVPLAATLAACDASFERLPDRSAMKTGTRVQGGGHQFGVCVGWDRRGFARRVAPAPAGDFLAGFDNSVVRGESCHIQNSFAFTGAVQFDISDLRGRPIGGAQLWLTRRLTNISPSIGGDFHGTCRLSVEMATEGWDPGDSFGSIASLPFAGRRESVSTTWLFIPESVGIDVTQVVQRWALGSRRNFGFVLKPAPGSTDRDDNSDTCTNYWTPTLAVTILRGR